MDSTRCGWRVGGWCSEKQEPSNRVCGENKTGPVARRSSAEDALCARFSRFLHGAVDTHRCFPVSHMCLEEQRLGLEYSVGITLSCPSTTPRTLSHVSSMYCSPSTTCSKLSGLPTNWHLDFVFRAFSCAVRLQVASHTKCIGHSPRSDVSTHSGARIRLVDCFDRY